MNLDDLTIEEVRAIQITDIRARLAARTPGSWLATLDDDGWRVNAVLDEGTPKERMETLARLTPASDTSDACFIASAADDIEVLLAEVERLTNALDEKEGDMHLRIRRGYDKTVSDAWKAWAAKIEKERDEARVERDAAYRRGVESMRTAAVEIASKRANLPTASDTDAAWCRSAQCIVDDLRELPVPEDKP